MNYTSRRRAEQLVRQLCRQHGASGDLFARHVPATGSLNEEETILDLCLSLPPDMLTGEKELARIMIRSAVISGGQSGQSTVGYSSGLKSNVPASVRLRREGAGR